MVTLKVLIGAVPTCMIIIGLCILMVGPALKVPSQDTSRRLSIQRWAPHAHEHTQRGYQHPGRHPDVCRWGNDQPAGLPAVRTPLNGAAFGDAFLHFSDAICFWIFFCCSGHPCSLSLLPVSVDGGMGGLHSPPVPFAVHNPGHLRVLDLEHLVCLVTPIAAPSHPSPGLPSSSDLHTCLALIWTSPPDIPQHGCQF